MPIALVVEAITDSRRQREVTFLATVTSPYVATGDPLDFTVATDPSQFGYVAPGVAPEVIIPIGGLGGRWCTPVKGTTNKNSKLKVWDTKDNELAAGAYPAALLADTLRIVAKFPKNV